MSDVVADSERMSKSDKHVECECVANRAWAKIIINNQNESIAESVPALDR